MGRRAERLLVVVLGWLASGLFGGCAIAARSDKFGAELDIGVGGIVSYVADLRVRANVGFSKTCTHEGTQEGEDHEAQQDVDRDPLGLLHFL